jgi:predicted transcriptional regulator YdeE
MFMLKIGEFARRSGISIRQLRHYHRLGLLRPTYVDRFSGYRYYSPDQLENVQQVRYLRSLGLSLAQVKDVMAEGPDALQRILIEHEADLTEELSSLRFQLKKVRQALDCLAMETPPPVSEIPPSLAQIAYQKHVPNKELPDMDVKIKQHAARKLIGIRGTFNIEAQKQENRIPALWDEFFKEYMEDLKPYLKKGAPSYGMCMPMTDDENFDYMVVFELAGDPPAELTGKLEVYDLPEMTYAVFPAPGAVDSIPRAYDYAHQTWFPQSEEYAYNAGHPDFEYYDERFKDFGPDSELDIYIPVKEK